MTQVEYWYRGEWMPVVRYDHDGEAVSGHDVTRDGLDRDVFRDGKKARVETVTGPILPDETFQYAEDDLRENVEPHIRRSERWQGIDSQ